MLTNSGAELALVSCCKQDGHARPSDLAGYFKSDALVAPVTSATLWNEVSILHAAAQAGY